MPLFNYVSHNTDNRGIRAGVKRNRRQRERAWRKSFKPAILTVVMGYIRSLSNKMEELESLVRSQNVYRESSLLCFTETWLKDCIPDSTTSITGFLTVWADWDIAESGKHIALFINNRRCNPGHVTTKERACTKDIKLLAVSMRPYYLPREYTAVITISVYIPPAADVEAACDVIHTAVARLQAKHPDAYILISGDFNHVSLSNTLPTFHQSVNCATGGSKTLDLLYANVEDAYESTVPPW